MNYVNCINNEGDETSLAKGEVYRTLAGEPSLSPAILLVHCQLPW